MLSSPDIMPTLLGLAGLADSIPAEVQGQQLCTAFFFDEKADIVRPTGALYIQNLDGRRMRKVWSVPTSRRAALNRRATRWRSTLTAKTISWSKVCCLTMKKDPCIRALNNLSLEENQEVVKTALRWARD